MSRIDLTAIHDRCVPVENFLQAAREAELELDRALRPRGVPLVQFRVLLALAVHNRPMAMTALAEAARTSKSSLSHLMDRMAKQGWVSRKSNDGGGDQRRVWALLTDLGAEMLRGALPVYARAVAVTQERLVEGQLDFMRGTLNGASSLHTANSAADAAQVPAVRRIA